MRADAELPFERFRYWPGQQVLSRDFTDQIAEAERASRWHNRAVHDAFGVRFGLDVTLEASESAPMVRVTCGVAFDCAGAMLVLQRSRDLDVPRLEPGESRLLLIRPRTPHGSCSCGTSGAAERSQLMEAQCTLEWSPDRGRDLHAGVPLARAWRSATSAVRRIDLSVRVLSRPLSRPRLGSGATIPGLTPWEPSPLRGFQTRVDTSAAGFTRTPAYFASLVVTRMSVTLAQFAFLLAFRHVAEATPSEFLFRIVLPRGFPFERMPVGIAEISRELGLAVCWLGCQPSETGVPRCPGQWPAETVCADHDREIG